MQRKEKKRKEKVGQEDSTRSKNMDMIDSNG